MTITTEDEYALKTFEQYFKKKAQAADILADSDLVVDSIILATTGLDALAKIWFHNFPKIKQELDRKYDGGIGESIRFSELLKNFAEDKQEVNKIAVVCFAQDWKDYSPEDSCIADELLKPRLSQSKSEFIRNREFPKQYLDVSLEELKDECSIILESLELDDRVQSQLSRLESDFQLQKIAAEYEYGAIIYNFYRNPLVHSSKSSDRTHGFAYREEIKYFWSYVEENQYTFGFGPNIITRWLREVVTNYVKYCRENDVIPAENLESDSEPKNKLKKRWKKWQKQKK